MRIKNARLFATGVTFGKTADGAQFLSVIIKGTFKLVSGGPLRPAAEQLPLFTADEPYAPEAPTSPLKHESDLVPFKPRTDVILVGHAYAPHGRPAKVVDVEIEVGPIQKKLRVFGDRRWSFPSDQVDAIPYIAGPAEFVKMPLTWDRAFGGIDRSAGIQPGNPPIKPWCESNYLGRGLCGARSVSSIHNTPLPNIEDPTELIRSWESRPKPTGCGFFPRNSRPRADWFGTFDDKWKAERAPELPLDFRFDAYNGADVSMQASPYLVGNEPVRLVNVTPGGGQMTCHLPGIQPKVVCAIGGQSTEARANLDTLVLVPDANVALLVWRAPLALSTNEASDVEQLRIEYDDQPPLSLGASA